MGGRTRSIAVEPVFEPSPEAAASLARLRRLAWLMDRSIPLGPGGRWRIGLDPLLGLMPGLGDWAGAVISLWVLYEGMRLGVPAPVLARMGANILIEAGVGAVPLLGDIFDAAWQANQRNVALVERHYDPRRRPRSMRRIAWAFAGFAVATLALVGALAWGMVWLLVRLFEALLG